MFKDLKKGVKRAIFAGTIPAAFILGWIIRGRIDFDSLLLAIVFGIPIYWVIVLIGVWVYDGFKEDK